MSYKKLQETLNEKVEALRKIRQDSLKEAEKSANFDRTSFNLLSKGMELGYERGFNEALYEAKKMAEKFGT